MKKDEDMTNKQKTIQRSKTKSSMDNKQLLDSYISPINKKQVGKWKRLIKIKTTSEGHVIPEYGMLDAPVFIRTMKMQQKRLIKNEKGLRKRKLETYRVKTVYSYDTSLSDTEYDVLLNQLSKHSMEQHRLNQYYKIWEKVGGYLENAINEYRTSDGIG